MPFPTVSCIIPVFNGAEYLKEALESVFSQSYSPIEIIVVDDGSTDATPNILESYGDRIQSLRQENAGPSAARNRGVQQSTGQLLCFLDADDIWVVDKTESQVAQLEDESHPGICTGYQKNFWIESLHEEELDAQNSALSEPHPGPSSTLMVRRSVFELIGLFDPQLRHRDTAAWLIKAREAGVKIVESEQLWVHRRIHLNNLSRNRGTQDADELFSLIRKRQLKSNDDQA
ncbi:MAG: glycosyltransferase family 2 protein [Planctomycetaceae bacterium]|nr:glycosyltransferase family 2 protein [Planctomycetaceae bacterium]